MPINHKFWDTHYPPNDWDCGCDVVQTDEDVGSRGVTVDDMPPNREHPYFKVNGFKKIADNSRHMLFNITTKDLMVWKNDKAFHHEILGSIVISRRSVEKQYNVKISADNGYLNLLLTYKLQELIDNAYDVSDKEPVIFDANKALRKKDVLYYRRIKVNVGVELLS